MTVNLVWQQAYIAIWQQAYCNACISKLNLCIHKLNYNFLSTIYNMSGRVVSDIQTRAEGESLYIWYNTDANVVNNLWNSLVLWIFWRSNFENTSYITRENQSYSLCKSTKICIVYTDAFTLMISFVFSSWIINEFHKIC